MWTMGCSQRTTPSVPCPRLLCESTVNVGMGQCGMECITDLLGVDVANGLSDEEKCLAICAANSSALIFFTYSDMGAAPQSMDTDNPRGTLSYPIAEAVGPAGVSTSATVTFGRLVQTGRRVKGEIGDCRYTTWATGQAFSFSILFLTRHGYPAFVVPV